MLRKRTCYLCGERTRDVEWMRVAHTTRAGLCRARQRWLCVGCIYVAQQATTVAAKYAEKFWEGS